MSWNCPECGYSNPNALEKCVCGYEKGSAATVYTPKNESAVNNPKICVSCGKQIPSGDMFCSFCGKKDWGFGWAFDWTIREAELKNQVENYETLSWSKSYRKISVSLILFFIILASIFPLVRLGLYAAIPNLLVYGILAFFMYKGYRWAFALGIIVWTLEKGFQFYDFITHEHIALELFGIIIWWGVYIQYFWKAFKVEQARLAVKESK